MRVGREPLATDREVRHNREPAEEGPFPAAYRKIAISWIFKSKDDSLLFMASRVIKSVISLKHEVRGSARRLTGLAKDVLKQCGLVLKDHAEREALIAERNEIVAALL